MIEKHTNLSEKQTINDSKVTKITNQSPIIRYFARLVSFTADINSNDVETLLVEAFDHLGIVIGREESNNKEFRAKLGEK